MAPFAVTPCPRRRQLEGSTSQYIDPGVLEQQSHCLTPSVHPALLQSPQYHFQPTFPIYPPASGTAFAGPHTDVSFWQPLAPGRPIRQTYFQQQPSAPIIPAAQGPIPQIDIRTSALPAPMLPPTPSHDSAYHSQAPSPPKSAPPTPAARRAATTRRRTASAIPTHTRTSGVTKEKKPRGRPRKADLVHLQPGIDNAQIDTPMSLMPAYQEQGMQTGPYLQIKPQPRKGARGRDPKFLPVRAAQPTDELTAQVHR
ncbi:MAG: hypothetical protein Q9170_005723 [Blastenia crenularia]